MKRIKMSVGAGALAAIFAAGGCVSAVTTTAGMATGAAVGVTKTAVKTSAGATKGAVGLAISDGDGGEEREKRGVGPVQNAAYADAPRPFDQYANAMMETDSAFAAARDSGRNVLLILGDNSCFDCRGLAAQIADPQLQQVIAEEYELVWVDVGYHGDNLDVAQRFGIYEMRGAPAVLIASPAGDLLNARAIYDLQNAHAIPFEEMLDYFTRFTGDREG